VHLYAVCWNEEKIIPWFLDHYRRFVDRFFIYDNGSTDATLALLAAAPNVMVYPHDTGGVHDNAALLEVKNNAWKASIGKADFVVVCDMDEFLHHPRMVHLLAHMRKHSYTVLKPDGYQMVCERMPVHDGTCLLTERIVRGVADFQYYSKTILFDPNRVDIGFQIGAHRSNPTGMVKTYQSDRAKLLHYKYVDRDEVLRKVQTYRPRLPVGTMHSRHYRISDGDAVAFFDQMLAAGRPVI